MEQTGAVSVLLSTRNRCDKLRLFLEAMKSGASAAQNETEIFVIDNNSSDATRAVVEEYTSLKVPAVRYLLKTEHGKSQALNSALREAKGDIIIFTDDDCIPGCGWVEGIVKEFDSDPELSVLGGRVELYDKSDLNQATLLSKFRTLITSPREVCDPPTVIGANMSFRKVVLEITGGFDPLLGPGAICKAAEDLDLIYRSLKQKFKIVYSPEVMVLHNHGRRTVSEDRSTSFAYAVGRGALYCKYAMQLDWQMTRIAFKELYGLTKTLIKGFVTRTDFPYHRLALLAVFLGAFYYCRAQLRLSHLFSIPRSEHNPV